MCLGLLAWVGIGCPPSRLALAGTCAGWSRCPSCRCPVGSVPRVLARIEFYQSGSSIVNNVLVHIVCFSVSLVLGVHDQLVHVDPLLLDHSADG